MAVQIGTAGNYLDLLDQLIVFLTTNSTLAAAGQTWQVKRDANPPALGHSGMREVQLMAPGLSGTEQWYSSIMAYENTLTDIYNWQLLGGVGYLASVDVDNQPGRSAYQYLHLVNSAIPYWFIANGRRVIVVAKISTTYQIAYIGAFLPYATPTQVPYPMFVGGSSSTSTFRWSNNSVTHKSFFDPSQYSSSVYYPDGTWQRPYNTNTNTPASRQQFINMSPYEGSGYTREVYTLLRDNVDSSYSMYPIQITMTSPANNVLGELDGMYATSGHNTASENLITVGGVDHLVVQDIFRTDRYNYCAIALA